MYHRRVRSVGGREARAVGGMRGLPGGQLWQTVTSSAARTHRRTAAPYTDRTNNQYWLQDNTTETVRNSHREHIA